MKGKTKKILSLVLALTMFAAVLAGCGGDKQVASDPAAESDQYPLETETTLSLWQKYSADLATRYQTRGETPFGQELEKRTGVHIDFMHPAFGQEGEQFNLLIASGELPDMIQYNFANNYPGGPDAAIEEGVVYPLEESFIKKYAPNYYKNIVKGGIEYVGDFDETKSDAGKMYGISYIRDDAFGLVQNGFIFRKDWLDALNLEVPTTIDEWEVVLKAFKENYPDASPLSMCYFKAFMDSASLFVGTYGVKSTFYRDEDQNVYFGPTQPGYKDFVTLLNKWYAAGYIDKEFTSNDKTIITNKVLSNKVGAFAGLVGGYFGNILDLAKDANPELDLVGAPYPTLEKGQRAKFGMKAHAIGSNEQTIITQQSDQKELALRWLDYGYSEEGRMFYNFGQEGLAYNMVDGFPTYTELITNSPEGRSVAQALGEYTMVTGSGPFLLDSRYYEQYMHHPQQVEAVRTWSETDEEIYGMPAIVLTQEEDSRLGAIMADINVYVEETTFKFITGQEPLENFDKFVETIKSLKIDEAIKIQKAALDRYVNK